MRHAPVLGSRGQPAVVSGPVARVIPPLDDENREFWMAGALDELRLPYCTTCGRFVFPVSLRCPDCDGPATYRAVSGRGRVFTYTVNHYRFHPEVPVPYVIGIVELLEQEGLRFTTDIVNCPVEAVGIGLPVRVVFEQQGEAYVPLFEPESDGNGDR